MTVHHIKIDTQYVDAVLTGLKPFEVRRNDRAYQVGDHIIMTEVGDPGEDRHWVATESGKDCSRCRIARCIAARISYVYSGDPRFGGHGGLQPGYVVLGLEGVDVSLPMTRVIPSAGGTLLSADSDAPESDALADLFETIEDAVGVRTLPDDTIEQIARYLIASGYTHVTSSDGSTP